MLAKHPTTDNQFRNLLKHWRNYRKMSQLDLALSAEVSQRHLSWLETGKSAPSREMILKLSEAMEVPLRERNQILNSAGFAPIFTQRSMDEPNMAPVTHVLTNMLSHHEPLPAMVLDRLWNLKMKNKAAELMFGLQGNAEQLWQAVGDDGSKNVALLTLHPKGLRQFISNWSEVAGPFLRRLKREATDLGDPAVIDKYRELESLAGNLPQASSSPSLVPVLPLELELGELKLSLFSVISTFGTAQDVTTDELRIETFYPTNEETANFFKSQSRQ